MGTILGRKVYQFSPGRIAFRCPGCDESHMIVVDGSRGWTWNGDGDKPDVNPSILARGKRRLTEDEYRLAMGGEKVVTPETVCHSFIRDGQWQFLGDCTHALAGQIVDVPDWPTGAEY